MFQAQPLLSDPDQLKWRNRFYDMVTGPDLEAIVAFGGNAAIVVDLWDNKPDVPTFKIPHPSNPEPEVLMPAWRTAIPDLRAVVTPDSDGSASGPNYGTDVQGVGLQPHPEG